MDSHLLIVGILTIGFTLASLFAYLTQRLKLPTVLGYLLAGYAIGPYSPGFVANIPVSEQLAEIGVILMLFSVGLHFKIEDLVRVKNIAIPGAIGQTVVATVATAVMIYGLGWTPVAGLIMGLSVGVASTVVLVRLLSENNILNTQKGHIAVGWLVVEDIITVIILILLPAIAIIAAGESVSTLSLTGSVLFVILRFVVLVLFMFTWGHKLINYILTNVARLRSQELFILTILALVFFIATVSSVVFETSLALGAFVAGMVIGKTHVKHQAASNALPIKDIFSVIFFLSVGMLFNPNAIVTHFSFFACVMVVVLIVKPLIAYVIALYLGYSLNTALTVSVALAQIGEFSFILAEEAMNLKLLPDDGFDILVACALISISLNPLFFRTIGFMERTIQKSPFFKRYAHSTLEAIEHQEPTQRMIVVGFGPIGRSVAQILKDAQFTPIIIEQNIDTVSSMHEQYHILFGDAEESSILHEAHIEDATHLFITSLEIHKTVRIIHSARAINPAIQVIVRIQYLTDSVFLEELDVEYVCAESEALKAFISKTHQLVKAYRRHI